MSEIYQQLEQIGILPVVTASRVAATVKLAEALRQSGLSCIEITCRTPAALDAIKAVKQADLDILVGAGTVTRPELLAEVVDLGVDFIVSPGVTDKLLAMAATKNTAFLPGVSSASGIMSCMDYGWHHLKLFPAIPLNAVALLPAFQAAFPKVRFCPTGGINTNNLGTFITMPNVFCVGGSWMVTPTLVENEDWEAITRLARVCMGQLADLKRAD